MAGARRIGILTGGGDVPGLNSVIKSVVYQTTNMNCEVLGIRRGWEGLTHIDASVSLDPAYIQPLNRNNTYNIDRTGGTILHTSRTNPSKMRRSSLPKHVPVEKLKPMEIADGLYDLTPLVLENLAHLGIDCLIAIGGDDTLSFAKTLDSQGVRVIGVPKTMDNDVRGTEYCIGFSTAISRASDAIERQRTTVASHERIGIFRIFGRDAGYTALYTAYACSLRCCIPEYKVSLDRLISLILEDKKNNRAAYALILLSEGAEWEGYKVTEYGEADAFGHRKKENIAEVLSDEIKKRSGDETIVSDLTYDLRGGPPDFVDKLVATTFAGMAVDMINENKSGLMMAINQGCYAAVPIPDPKLGPRKIDVATMYNTDRYRATYSGKIGLPVFLTRA
jgi:6-phosphofructokinase 1